MDPILDLTPPTGIMWNMEFDKTPPPDLDITYGETPEHRGTITIHPGPTTRQAIVAVSIHTP